MEGIFMCMVSVSMQVSYSENVFENVWNLSPGKLFR